MRWLQLLTFALALVCAACALPSTQAADDDAGEKFEVGAIDEPDDDGDEPDYVEPTEVEPAEPLVVDQGPPPEAEPEPEQTTVVAPDVIQPDDPIATPVTPEETANSSTQLGCAPSPTPQPTVSYEMPAELKTYGRYAALSRSCFIHEQPQSDSATLNQVDVGRRVWIEYVNEDWRRVYRRAGPAFLFHDCLELN